MKRSLTITDKPIAESEMVSSRVIDGDMGAVATFLGVVRRREAGENISALDYEAFTRMAEHQFGLLFDQMEKRWPISSVRLVHRVGRVSAGHPSLWVEVISPHRGEAFAACAWLIEEMKRVVPIWKRPVK